MNADAGVAHRNESFRGANEVLGHRNVAGIGGNETLWRGDRRGSCVNWSSKPEDDGGNCGREGFEQEMTRLAS